MRPKRLVIVALCAVLCLTACAKRSRTVALPPPPPAVAVPAPVASALEQADSAFGDGRYEEAARGYEKHLIEPSSGERDHALFRLGLALVLRTSPAPDWPRATNLLKQLVDEHSGSPLKPAAILILSLRAELDKVAADSQQRDQRIRQLTSELDRLKKIDADRRKRP